MSKKNDVEGQITIIAALSLTLILSLVAAVFQSARLSALNVHIQQSCRLAAEAVFSGYSNTVLDEFDVLLLKESDMMDGKAGQYIQDNLSGEKDAAYVSAAFDTVNMVTDGGGENIQKEILAYMKYGFAAQTVSALMQSEQQVKKSEKVKEITEQIVNCEECIYEMDAQVLKLVQLVEGVETNDSGLVLRSGKPQPVSEYFAKAAIMGEITMTSARVNQQKIYDAVNHVTTRYTNVDELIKNMMMDVEDLSASEEEQSQGLGSNSYGSTYRKGFDTLQALIIGSTSSVDEALNVIAQYKTTVQTSKKNLDDVMATVEDSRGVIGEELGGEFLSDLSEMSENAVSPQRNLCNVEEIEDALWIKKGKLDAVKECLPRLDVNLNKEKCAEVKAALEQCMGALAGLTNNQLQFDYSGIDFDTQDGGMSSIRKIYSTLTDGLMRLVLEEKTVSDKQLQIRDLASQMSGSASEKGDFISEAADTALMDTYILDKFSSYTDLLDEDGNYDQNKIGTDLLEYSVEYILCGADSDEENLRETILKLSIIREGMNLAYLLTDQEKKAEALALATSLLGFTGNLAVIKGGQYLILTVWAYGESIVELRQLYEGGRVELAKRKDQWQLSLSNLLSYTLEGRQIGRDEQKDKGMCYEDYLGVLLFVQNPVQKNFQVMGAMESRLIGMGNADFRMKDYIFAASGQAIFTRRGMNGYYTREIQYSYG